MGKGDPRRKLMINRMITQSASDRWQFKVSLLIAVQIYRQIRFSLLSFSKTKRNKKKQKTHKEQQCNILTIGLMQHYKGNGAVKAEEGANGYFDVRTII